MERIVVGFDGSGASVAALRWAAAEARMYDAMVEAWTVFARNQPALLVANGHEAGAERARIVLAEMIEHTAPGAGIVHNAVDGSPAVELVRLSHEADLLVVGSRGHSAVPGLLLGSVSRACLHGAASPVAVVRADQKAGPANRPVVVGIDGSPSARLALNAAVREARVRHTELHVVHAVYSEDLGLSLLTPGTDDLLTWGRQLVDAEVAHAVIDVPVRSSVLLGHPADVLTSYSERAALLVLGSRGHGGLPALLGSVSAHCAAASACPTLVVRSN